ncbi:MAG: hypothetical protein Q7T70_02560 [Polaromonas sp.]|nr:hypothetical protein [Polaromonas sp.]
MTRLPDWQTRFAEFGSARARMPFSWGSNDCCSFAAAAVEAITGRNPMDDVVPYDTEAAAGRLILRAGDLRALASQYLGESVQPVFAAVGDVVLVVNAGREALGICNGVNVIGPGVAGIDVLGIDAALAAWKI